MNRAPALIALLACLCCERSATPGTQMAQAASASSTTSSTSAQLISDAPEEAALPQFQIVAPDSSEGDWYLDTEDMKASPEFFVGSHVRHPSGVVVIWFDTAVRATEDHPVGRARADSVVVEGVQHLEYLGRFCAESDGLTVPRVIGLVAEADTTARPRLAWRFNAQTYRIERYPVDSIRCMVNEPVDDVD